VRTRLPKRLLASIIATSSALLVVGGLVNPTPAAATCTGGHEWDGVDTYQGSNTIGSNANISNYHPRIPCASPSSWVMVYDYNSSGLAQVGWERGNPNFGNQSETHFFVEYDTAAGVGTPLDRGEVPSPANTDLTHKYSVWLQGSTIYFTIDDVGKYNIDPKLVNHLKLLHG
jgi:hypothetical protein